MMGSYDLAASCCLKGARKSAMARHAPGHGSGQADLEAIRFSQGAE